MESRVPVKAKVHVNLFPISTRTAFVSLFFYYQQSEGTTGGNTSASPEEPRATSVPASPCPFPLGGSARLRCQVGHCCHQTAFHRKYLVYYTVLFVRFLRIGRIWVTFCMELPLSFAGCLLLLDITWARRRQVSHQDFS